MTISAAQCRAARALLDWTQDQLAENAQVARTTIVDFERNTRLPMRNNMVSIRSAFEAAGIEFMEENGSGAGVRFRKVKLEYSKDVKADNDGVTMRVRYRGTRYNVRIPSEVIDDIDRTTYDTPEQLGRAVERHLPIFLSATENAIINGQFYSANAILLDHDKLPQEIF